MSKKNLLKILDYSSYVSLIIASFFVLFYEVLGEPVLMKLSVVMYGAAFLMLVALCVIKLIFIKNEVKENDEIIIDKTQERIPWIYVKLVLATICFAFTVVFFAVM